MRCHQVAWVDFQPLPKVRCKAAKIAVELKQDRTQTEEDKLEERCND